MGNVFLLVSIGLNVLGQTVLKSGVDKLGALSFEFSSILKAFTSFYVLGGLFLYFVSSIFWILALSQKELSYAYPMLSIGYIVIILVSWFLLGENISLIRVIGVIFISVGIFLVYKSA